MNNFQKYSKLSDDSDRQRHRLYRAVPLPIRQLLETSMSAGKSHDWDVVAIRVTQMLPAISKGAQEAWIRVISSCEISRAGEKRWRTTLEAFCSSPYNGERSSYGFAEMISTWQIPSISSDVAPWITQRSLRGIDLRSAADEKTSHSQQETRLSPLSNRLDKLVMILPLGLPSTVSSLSLGEDSAAIGSGTYEPKKVQDYLANMEEQLMKSANSSPTTIAKCESAEDEFDPDLPQYDRPPASSGRRKDEGGKKAKKKNDDDA